MRIRTFLSLSALGLATLVQGQAAWAGQVEDGLERCSQIPDYLTRLSCFDELARVARTLQDLGTPNQAPPGAQFGSALARPVAPTQPSQATTFGLNAPQLRERQPDAERPLDELAGTVKAIKPYGPGYYTITLRDGAVWRTTEVVASFRPPAPGTRVTVRRGSLGGFLLDAGNQASIRVARIK